MRAGPRPGPSRGLAGARAAEGTGPGLGWGAARAQGSPRHRPAGLPLRGTCQKGKEQGLRASGLQAGWSRREGRGSGLQPSVSWHWSQPPAHLRQGTLQLLPFPAWKAPSLPPPCPGLWGPQGETWSPQEQPCPQVPVPGPARTLGLPAAWGSCTLQSLGREGRHSRPAGHPRPGPALCPPAAGVC